MAKFIIVESKTVFYGFKLIQCMLTTSEWSDGPTYCAFVFEKYFTLIYVYVYGQFIAGTHSIIGVLNTALAKAKLFT